MRFFVKHVFLFFFLLGMLQSSYAVTSATEQPLIELHKHMQHFAGFRTVDDKARSIQPEQLPSPYNYLLTQPLMTLGIKNYYQRMPIIQTLSAMRDTYSNTYSRIIVMRVPLHKNGDVDAAKKNSSSKIVEIAFITMNFNALPANMIDGILHSHVPFGQLLVDHHIKVTGQNRSYFSLPCEQQFASLTHCVLNSKLYGRTNTLVRKDTQQWVAQVVEILPTQ